jgi:hypothetical protein
LGVKGSVNEKESSGFNWFYSSYVQNASCFRRPGKESLSNSRAFFLPLRLLLTTNRQRGGKSRDSYSLVQIASQIHAMMPNPQVKGMVPLVHISFLLLSASNLSDPEFLIIMPNHWMLLIPQQHGYLMFHNSQK